MTAQPLYNTSENLHSGDGTGGTGRDGGGWWGSLLLSPPDDDHAGGIGRCQQALVAVEADVQHGAAVTLQLVHDGLGVPLHVEEVHTAVLAASHCWRKEGGGYREFMALNSRKNNLTKVR